MNKIKEEYIVEGYLVDKFGNKISGEFREPVMAVSFEQAESRVVYRIKTERLHLARNFPAKLKQIEGKHFTHRKHRDD